MTEKQYEWGAGAVLEEHSHRKHKILREYFSQYLAIRCQLPQQERFRLAVVDGFAGGGIYQGGFVGSPIIFIEELRNTLVSINTHRKISNLPLIEIECLLIFNDFSRDAIDSLKSVTAPLLAEVKSNDSRLTVNVLYLNEPFESAYLSIKKIISDGRYKNVIFNLDQCGHSKVASSTIIDIMSSYPSVEVFYTFAIQALISFLEQENPSRLAEQLSPIGIRIEGLSTLDSAVSKKAWLGTAERLVFETFKTYAPFVSPFSINNPNGWLYWFIHFANNYRARQVYNNVLHKNSTAQAHFGRSGLNMLSYDPRDEDSFLYLFDASGRESAKAQLLSDIPRFISDAGDAIGVGAFYEEIYNATPAHTDDVHQAIIDNPDIEVITSVGGERRSANTINISDTLRLRRQKSFFQPFLSSRKRG